ncbi:hypothetical protein SE963_28310 [Escherichia coli]|nr:hypothetical protein [Escherichia coli]MDX1859219.1 hypothetical protein [Escherichia coli]
MSQEKKNNESGIANKLPPQGDKSTQTTKEPAIKGFSLKEKKRENWNMMLRQQWQNLKTNTNKDET